MQRIELIIKESENIGLSGNKIEELLNDLIKSDENDKIDKNNEEKTTFQIKSLRNLKRFIHLNKILFIEGLNKLGYKIRKDINIENLCDKIIIYLNLCNGEIR